MRTQVARKLISAACLLALMATPLAALAGPLLAADSTDCCTGRLCAHQRNHSAPARPDCHASGGASGGTLSECSMRACRNDAPRGIGLQPYILPEPSEITGEVPAAFLTSPAALYFPAPAPEIDSPPPRPAFV